MSHIYIAFVDTPGIFASIIRNVLKQRYIHVAIGMDERMEEAYIGYTYTGLDHMYGYAGYKICIYYMMAEKEIPDKLP